MNKHMSTPADEPQRWRLLVEADIFETNTDNLCKRIEDAHDAIMKHIEK